MKKITKILFILLSLSVATAVFATVATGPVTYNTLPETVPLPGELTFVSYLGAYDTAIITERAPQAYVSGNWAVNLANFPNAIGPVTFNIKLDAGGMTASQNNVSVDTSTGLVRIPATGKTVLNASSTLGIPTLSIARGDASLVLTWDPVAGATSYHLYRCTVSNGGYFERISNNAVSPYVDNGLTNNTTYYYVLVALNGATRSPHSNYISETPASGAGSYLLDSIAISPTTAQIFDGASQSFSVTAVYKNGAQTVSSQLATSAFTLSINPSLGTVSGNVYTAPDPVATDGTPVTVTAHYLTKTADSTVTLKKRLASSISISPTTATLYDGQTQNFTVTANYNDGTSRTVTTATVTPSGSGHVDVSGSNYTYSAPTTILADEQVMLNAVLDTKTASATITLLKKALQSIRLSPSGVVLQQGNGQQFTVTATYNGSRDADVTYDPATTWSSGVGQISSSGYLTATQGGNGTVTANYTYGDAPRTATANVLLAYSSMYLKVESGKANVYAKDTSGIEFPVTSYDSIVFSATGTPDGNRVAADGTLTEGNKEGTYAVNATVVIASSTFTPTGSWTINKGAPIVKVMIGTTQVSNDSTISNTPTFTIKVTDGNGVKSVQLFVDGTEITAPTLALTANDAASTSVTATYAVSAAAPLTAGTHYLRIITQDNLGTSGTVDITGLKVYDVLQVQGIPMNYPNPFKPSSGVGTKIHYTLTQAADIKLMIYDLSGRPVYTVLYPSDPNGTSQGGHAGINEPIWDGKDFNGKIVPNGVYKYFITSAGKVLASGEIALYD